MKGIYKSIEGERLVLERYRAFLKYWPVPNRQVRVPTSQGETFVIISGPEDAPALILLHGGMMNSAMWISEVTAFARFFRVYCIDMIGEPGLSAPARPALASDAYARWLDDVLDHLAIARALMLGTRDVLLDSAQTKQRLEAFVNGAQVVYLPEAGHMIAGQTATVLAFMTSGRN